MSPKVKAFETLSAQQMERSCCAPLATTNVAFQRVQEHEQQSTASETANKVVGCSLRSKITRINVSGIASPNRVSANNCPFMMQEGGMPPCSPPNGWRTSGPAYGNKSTKKNFQTRKRGRTARVQTAKSFNTADDLNSANQQKKSSTLVRHKQRRRVYARATHLESVAIQVSTKERCPAALGHGVGHAGAVQPTLEWLQVRDAEGHVPVSAPVLWATVDGVWVG